MNIRIGQGIDFHQLTEGRKLYIGGVEVPHTKGALGHSDADVLLHAVCDALLGALSLGDIGTHFPDTSDEYKGIDSKILLQKTYELVKSKNFLLINADATVCLQLPKIKPYIEDMRKAIAQILEVTENDISIKATTTERMGFAGREEGLFAQAVVLLAERV